MLELVELEMIELLTDFGFDGDNTPMIHGSALLALRGDQGEFGEPSIHKLIDALDRHIPDPQRDNQSPFLMPIDNFIGVPGRGTVVIGTIKRGCVKRGDALEILGFGANVKTSATAIQVFKQEVPQAQAGDNVGINLKQVKQHQLKKGMLLTAKDSCKPTNHFEGTVYFLTKAEGGRSKPILSKYMQMIHIDTWSMSFRLDLPTSIGMLMPGEQANVRITLHSEMPLMDGQHFTIRENNVTVATGRIAKLYDPLEIPRNSKLAKASIKLD